MVRLLLEQGGYITVEAMAKELSVSSRTLYRELPEVTKLLNEHGVELETVSKKGLRVQGSSQSLQELRHYLGLVDQVDIVSPEERMEYILLYLLHEEDYIKAEAIAIDHQYALSTVRSDLQKARQFLSRYDLHLVQQRGQGILIAGSLMEKNHVMTDILLGRVDEVSFFGWLEEEVASANPFLRRMEEYGFRDTMCQMLGCIREALAEAQTALIRLRSRECLELVLLLSFMMYYHGTPRQYSQYMGANLEKADEQALLRGMRSSINDFFYTELSESEATYLQWVLLMCMGQGASVTTVRNQALNEHIVKFIQSVEDSMGIALSHDQELAESLYAHMDKALLRIRSNMQIENPALLEIKADYPELFQVIHLGVSKNFPSDYFPEDEIGYLVLYFALALDKLTKRLFRVLVVCSGGMGSSKMLASQLERQIPEVKVVKTASMVMLDKENPAEYDLILSTIPLYMDKNAYLRVSPLLKENDVLLIKEKIRRHKHRMLRHIDQEEQAEGVLLNEDNEAVLTQLGLVCRMSLDISDAFRLVITAREEGVLRELVRTLGEYDWFREEDLRMDKDSCFLLPTTEAAYCEGVCETLTHPLILAYRFDGDRLPTLPTGDCYAAALVVLYPGDLEQCQRKALRHLISAIIQDRRLIDCVMAGSSEGIRNWISFQTREYVRQLVK